MNANQTVINAINNMKTVDKEYFVKTLNQRLAGHPDQAGSIIEKSFMDADELEEGFLSVNWAPFYHPNISEGCRGFVTTEIGGWLGVVDLSVLEELGVDKTVTLDDRKGTGKVSCVVIGDQDIMEFVHYVVMIVGPEKDLEVMYTVHPGEPVSPSSVSAEPGMHGKVVTIGEALAMGLTTAKIVRS